MSSENRSAEDRPDRAPGSRDNAGGRRGRRPRAGTRGPGDGAPPAPSNVPDEDLVLVQFKGHRKGYYNNRRNIPLKVGQYCVVDADRGRDMGRVTYLGKGHPEWWVQARKLGVVAVASPRDLEVLHNNRGDEWEFYDICLEKIQNRRLSMNLVSVERQFDHKKITFYFTAEKRVDFRSLVRDLAAVFRTRIELRQIGVRDEARLKGGLGICGREFCCSGFLHDFVPVTLKMAKVQQLPLNPAKLSGPCGRLRCCMTYEHAGYQEAKRRLPKVGTPVTTPEGPGVVRKLDLLQGQVAVAVQGKDGLLNWDVADVQWDAPRSLPDPRPRSGGCGGGGCC